MTDPTPYLRYLAIPPDYGPTAGLRWSNGGEAIEMADGRTFFVKAGLPRFLEGFASQRPLVHFVYILELLHLLGHRDERPVGIPREIAGRVCEAFRVEGLPLRNAGAFFGVICREVPQTNLLDPEFHLCLTKWLATQPVINFGDSNDPIFDKFGIGGALQHSEDPPLSVDAFHQMLNENLATYNEDELRHWFRHGNGPIYPIGKRLAEEVVNVKPSAPRGTLDDLVRERPRLAGALPLVGSMIGALSLPPRKRTPPKLPLGGYADVTTRGDPERLLISQFALDSDEFVRRFAEKELLFFQREEPPQHTRESLVLLVDQGVRTWGVVRLALSAAVLAFRKLAERKKQAWTVRFSGALDERLDPETDNPRTMVDRLEASDLSPSPARLLEAEAANELPEDADIVLLTHPLSLHDQSVHKAGRDLPANKRLFALAVDEEGAAQFSQVRLGESVPISRFRVHFREPEIEQPLPPLPMDERMWTGDVEPVQFPFRIGPFRNLVALDFDAGTTHLLAATQKGYLHLWKLHDGQLQVLPRAFLNSQVLLEPESVLGLHGGFVVGGVLGTDMVAAHYDLLTRTVKVYKAGSADDGARYWFVFPKQRTILIRRQDGQATVLDSIKLDSEDETSRYPKIPFAAQDAINRLQEPSWVPVFEKGTAPSTAPLRSIETADGEVTVCVGSSKLRFRLAEDGKPIALRGRKCRAQIAAGTLALAVDEVHGDGVIWRLLGMNDERLLAKYDSKKVLSRLCRLSPDGQLFALVGSHAKINVRVIGEASLNRLATAPGRVHTNLAIRLFPTFIRIVIGSRSHSLSWESGIVHRFQNTWDNQAAGDGFLAGKHGPKHELTNYDPSRFVSVFRGQLDALVDVAGQITIYDPRRKEIVCIFFPRREHLAAWLPDGTRWGPADLIGGPATPDALERIGQALRRASSEGGA